MTSVIRNQLVISWRQFWNFQYDISIWIFQDWESYASSRVSISSNLKAVTNQVIEWRKLELKYDLFFPRFLINFSIFKTFHLTFSFHLILVLFFRCWPNLLEVVDQRFKRQAFEWLLKLSAALDDIIKQIQNSDSRLHSFSCDIRCLWISSAYQVIFHDSNGLSIIFSIARLHWNKIYFQMTGSQREENLLNLFKILSRLRIWVNMKGDWN